VQSRFHGGFSDLQIVGDLSRRPGLVVRAANHGAVLGGEPCQRVADPLPICHEIHHPGGAPIPFATAVISTTLPTNTVTTRFGNDIVLVSYQEPSCVNI
jgi:hypothetical protein